MKYLIVDAYIHGTGIRDKYAGGYIDPASLNVSSNFKIKLTEWLKKYEKEFYNQYSNSKKIKELDAEGEILAFLLKKELLDVKIEYYSDATMTSKLM